MGKKSKSTTGPSKQALPYLNQASGALNAAYGQSSQLANNAVSTLNGYLPQVLEQTMSNDGLAAAGAYNQRVLGGEFLNNSPYLQAIINDTSAGVTDRVNSAIGTRGLAGGSAQTQLLGRELARAENSLRYQDYNAQLGRMDNAVSAAAGLSSAQNQGIATLLAYLNGTAQLPMAAAAPYASGINNLWGNSTTTTQSQGLGSSIGGLLGSGLAGWASGGFKF